MHSDIVFDVETKQNRVLFGKPPEKPEERQYPAAPWLEEIGINYVWYSGKERAGYVGTTPEGALDFGFTPDELVIKLAEFCVGSWLSLQEDTLAITDNPFELIEIICKSAGWLIGANPDFDINVLAHYSLRVKSAHSRALCILRWTRFGLWLSWIEQALRKNQKLEPLGVTLQGKKLQRFERCGKLNFSGINLNRLAWLNLQQRKIANVVQLDRNEDFETLCQYCANDVRITAELFKLGVSNKCLLVSANEKVPVPFAVLLEMTPMPFEAAVYCLLTSDAGRRFYEDFFPELLKLLPKGREVSELAYWFQDEERKYLRR